MTGRRRRRGRVAGTDVPVRAPDYRNLHTPFSPQLVFSDDEIAALHANALCVLAELGIRNLLLEARAVFRAAGLRGARWIGGDRCLVGSRRTGPGATRRPRRADALRQFLLERRHAVRRTGLRDTGAYQGDAGVGSAGAAYRSAVAVRRGLRRGDPRGAARRAFLWRGAHDGALSYRVPSAAGGRSVEFRHLVGKRRVDRGRTRHGDPAGTARRAARSARRPRETGRARAPHRRLAKPVPERPIRRR